MSIICMPFISNCMQRSIAKEKAFFADEKNLFFSADNTFKPLETVAVKIDGLKPVMGTIREEIKKGVYVVVYDRGRHEKDVVAKDIGKLMPQGPANAEAFSFRAGNTFSTGETVAVKNEAGVLVMGTVFMKQPFTNDRYIVIVGEKKTPYPISSIGKLKANMGVLDKMKSIFTKKTTAQEPHEYEAYSAREEIFKDDEGITSENLQQKYAEKKRAIKKETGGEARKKEQRIESSYKALKVACRISEQRKRASDSLNELFAAPWGYNTSRHKIMGAIKDGADIEAKYALADNQTPLQWAMTNHRHDAIFVTQLIQAGANINTKSSTGVPVLIWAIEHDYDDLVKLLIEKHVDVTQSDKGYTALMAAIKRHSLPLIMTFLHDKNINVNSRALSGDTALSLALDGFTSIPPQLTVNQLSEIIEELLEKKADANLGNSMIIAAFDDKVPVIIFGKLLSHGARVWRAFYNSMANEDKKKLVEEKYPEYKEPEYAQQPRPLIKVDQVQAAAKTLSIDDPEAITERALKSKVYRLLMQWHPDRQPENIEEATRKTKEITAAYDIIKKARGW